MEITTVADGASIANPASKAGCDSLTPLKEMRMVAVMVRRLSAWMAAHSPDDADQTTREAFAGCAEDIALLHDRLFDWTILSAGWQAELEEAAGKEEVAGKA